MVIGRNVSFSDPARPPGGSVGRPKHPKIPPSEKKISRGKKNRNFSPPPPPNFYFFCVLGPQEDVFAKKKSVTKNFHAYNTTYLGDKLSLLLII